MPWLHQCDAAFFICTAFIVAQSVVCGVHFYGFFIYTPQAAQTCARHKTKIMWCGNLNEKSKHKMEK
jgi:hypothetical protein